MSRQVTSSHSQWMHLRNLVVFLTLFIDISAAFLVQRGGQLLLKTAFKHSYIHSKIHMSAGKKEYEAKLANGKWSVDVEVGGKTITFETGKIGRQANGAVLARVADTMVYSTACFQREMVPVDFTPLKVDYFARYSAVGQTVGAYHRRDSRGDDNEILAARLIDRPIRPMISEGWQHDTQLLTWVLSYDKEHTPEALAVCAASAALAVSQVPLISPVAAVEVGINITTGAFIINPTKSESINSTLTLTIAGTVNGILMIEGMASLISEDIMLQAISAGHEAIKEICHAISALQKSAGKTKKLDDLRVISSSLLSEMDKLFGQDITKALANGESKEARGGALAAIEKEIVKRFVSDNDPVADRFDDDADVVAIVPEEEGVVIVSDQTPPHHHATTSSITTSSAKTTKSASSSSYNYDPIDVKLAIKKLLVRRLRDLILQTGKRSDGRGVEDVRAIDTDTSLLPGAHGSAIFTRGETQVIATATLGSKGMAAASETLDAMISKRFYLQYRFPPCSVGEVGRVGGINRREVGHGNLAERALVAAYPDSDTFPYVTRAESLVTESAGSSSMASVCGCCLAMLDAGVPLKTIIAGVAMGLILGETPSDEPVVLTDILGFEDALGTMDFKVAGNEVGISAFQLDIKSEGLTLDVLRRSLAQAKRGRDHILQLMKAELSEPRKMKDSIPKVLEMKVPPEILGKIIGPKGKNVQALTETYGLRNINLEDDGTIQIESLSLESNEACKQAILKIVEESNDSDGGRGGRGESRGGSTSTPSADKAPPSPPPETGLIYRGCRITGIHSFGVFVEVLPGHEGLVHVSELDVKRVTSVEASFTIGQELDVKNLGKNEKGQLRLSRRAVLLRDSTATVTGNRVIADIVAKKEEAKKAEEDVAKQQV